MLVLLAFRKRNVLTFGHVKNYKTKDGLNNLDLMSFYVSTVLH